MSADAGLTPRSEARGGIGVLPGFGVLFEKEILDATRSKRMLIFLVIMTAGCALVATLAYYTADHFGGGARHTVSEDDMGNIVGSWAALIGYLGSLMVIASTVDAVSGERALGVSAWIITKPVSRLSYLLAKAVAHTVTSLATLVVIPTVVFIALMVLLFNDVPMDRVLLALLLLSIEMTFLSFLIISLGVPLKTVMPIALIGLAFWFIPNFVPAIGAIEWTYRVIPSYLPLLAVAAAYGDGFEWMFVTVPVAALIVAGTAFVGAVLVFERQEM